MTSSRPGISAQSGWQWVVAGGRWDRGGQVHYVGHLGIITGEAQRVQGPRRVDTEAPGALMGAIGR